jgi:hypothetical protein
MEAREAGQGGTGVFLLAGGVENVQLHLFAIDCDLFSVVRT